PDAEATALTHPPEYAGPPPARMQLPQLNPEGRGKRAPRRGRKGRDSAAHRLEPTLREGVRFAGLLAGRNLRRDVRVVQASRMRPRSVPVLRTRPPRFLGLHADAGPGRGRRTPNDTAGAAALQGLGRANRERTPLRADRRSGD